MRILLIPILVISSILPLTAAAQQLPAPSRTVFKCEQGGKVLYSDEPCLDAKKVDVEPSRGLTTTGKEAAGADVRREVQREQFAEIVRPVTSMTPKEFEVARKRVYLPQNVQRECAALDTSVPLYERRELEAKGNELRSIQSALLIQRKRFRELKC